MGIARGVVSYTPYLVEGALGSDWKAAVLDGLIRGRVTTIDAGLGRDKAIGFAVFSDPLDTDFTEEKVFADPLVLFSLRMDRLVVPTSTLRLHVRRRVAEVLEATRRHRLPREEREEIEEQVRTDLLRRALPAITACEVVWDTRSGRLRLASTSPAMGEELMVRMREFLGLELKPLNLVGVLETCLNEDEVEQAYRLLPTSFVPATVWRTGHGKAGAPGRGAEEDRG